MTTDTIKEFAAARGKLAELEASLAADLKKELAGLPATYGFASTKAFLRAVKVASGIGRGRAKGRRTSGRSRARITNTIRAKVKKMVKAGKKGAEIAEAAGISLPSVHNIKKSLGLVRARGSKTR